MEFKLLFPTLKSLSSLRICLHWADHKIGPFQAFFATWGFERNEKQSHLIIDGLPIHRSLKAAVGDVLCGILKQLNFWRTWREITIDQDQPMQFVYFDAFGRFDEQRTLKPFFQKAVAEEDDLHSLHQLLTLAYTFWLLPEVDTILRKMVAIASHKPQSEILLEGPEPDLRHGKYHLVYRICGEDAEETLKSIGSPESSYMATIDLDEDSIAIAPGREREWNFDAFKDHFDLFKPSERKGFIKDLPTMGIRNRVDILTFLKQKNDQRNWMLVLRQGYNLCRRFLEDLLTWPFVSFFIAAFKHLAPHLKFDDYPALFSSIVGNIRAEQQYGELHRSLLVDYWSVLTADEKRKCATFSCFQLAMDDLKVKAPALHDGIKTELDSLRTATEEEVLPKRRRLG